jgi:predicted Zn-dependent protease
MTTPEDWHARSIAAEQKGNLSEGLRILRQALAEHPDHAQLHNSAGSMAMRSEDAAEAEAAFARALELVPGNSEFVVNRAIALGRLGRNNEALSLLSAHERACASEARYWSVRGATARAAGNQPEAAKAYDRCLAIDPHQIKGLHGRARTAIDRGEYDAVARFDAALLANKSDPDLWLGKAQALDVQGDSAAARGIAQQLVVQIPQWLEALKFFAQLRLAAGDSDFTSHYLEAAGRAPDDPNILFAHAAVLAGLDYAEEAADVAAEAQRRFPRIPALRLVEAVYAGEAGQHQRAEEIFAGLDLDTSERAIHEARHRMRLGEFDRAEKLLGTVLADRAAAHSVYALLGLIWRLKEDPRAIWQHEQEGLVRLLPLRDAESVLLPATKTLHKLHDNSPLPLGQSLRGGTQTRHILFDRHEPEFANLRTAIEATLEDYRAGLPPFDESHPLLRHRDDPWSLAGSWSVRMSGGGDYHTSHIHPQGMLSSALYLIVPEDTKSEGKKGWLEIGRPPPDLGLDLGPLISIEPREGYLALFPSTLYHGTTSFGDGLRMTVAFDVVPAISARYG